MRNLQLKQKELSDRIHRIMNGMFQKMAARIGARYPAGKHILYMVLK